ncbi:cytoskeletal protein CcmA (bactofilin family) [Thiogranum longum]|uniref:Cytoskeletal protein CcmA (Bactofilin family) n=1 Tax=Thiogranum longum TaxID=1537524 RepID=A0A4R1HCS6_9GAMM|nr:polymer-forming cytoskeletal protein [Thiogranum longum]TCK19258.1 cytoskeletal protein CcmA (bactofilin family) [Thiogranum longum]
MFGWGKSAGCSGIDTIIGQHTRLKGNIHFSGGLHIDGRVEGNIIAESGSGAVLTVSEQGAIEGDVQVPNLVLNGAVVGDVHVSGRVELASHARVTGNLYYCLIEMAMGAEVNGNMVHRKALDPSELSGNEEAPVLGESSMTAIK